MALQKVDQFFFLDQNEKIGEVNKQRCKKLLQEKQAKKKTFVKKYRNLKQQKNKGCLGEMKKSTQSLLGVKLLKLSKEGSTFVCAACNRSLYFDE